MITIGFVFVGAGLTLALVLNALNENINLFYPPDQIVAGAAPAGAQIRAGGMVLEGSVARPGNDLDVEFVLTDYQGSQFKVFYSGILPDLFREGQGILVRGQLDAGGTFQAEEVLAKHDENYMPPELVGLQHAAPDNPGG